MKIFLLGVKGSGMSSLGIILKGFGHEVLGSDITKRTYTQEQLEKNNIEIVPFETTDFIDSDIDEIIIGNAFLENHPEVIKAKESGIPTKKYNEKLNEVIASKKSIAVSGTNGKTTTTGLVKATFQDKGISYLIGDGDGFGNVDSDIFAFEACEYKETFLGYHPDYLIISNIEMDHPDFFRDVNHVIEVFQKFANQAKHLIVNGDDENCLAIKHDDIKYFGTHDNANLQAVNVEYIEEGIKLTLIYNKENLGEFVLPFYGEHMLYNSLSVLLTALEVGEDINDAINNISKFKGVQRRFNEEVISEDKNIKMIDDYAHHPSAIRLTINAVKQKYPNASIITAFQPHTYSRTKEFLHEFAEELSLSDKVLLVDIFGSAREQKGDITIDDLANEINKIDENKLITFEDLTGKEEDQVICILGAGDIDLLYKDRFKKLYSK